MLQVAVNFDILNLLVPVLYIEAITQSQEFSVAKSIQSMESCIILEIANKQINTLVYLTAWLHIIFTPFTMN